MKAISVLAFFILAFTIFQVSLWLEATGDLIKFLFLIDRNPTRSLYSSPNRQRQQLQLVEVQQQQPVLTLEQPAHQAPIWISVSVMLEPMISRMSSCQLERTWLYHSTSRSHKLQPHHLKNDSLLLLINFIGQ